MAHKSVAKDLLNQRDELDSKINELLLVLEVNKSTMDSPLVDSEGFPLNDIDVYAVRHARHDLICLRNDREQLTKRIANELEIAHSENTPIEKEVATEKPVHRTSNNPFVKVSAVTESSPADEGGIKKDDLILQYGSLHFDNFSELKQLAQITNSSENKIIRVTVLRSDHPIRLEIRPHKWSGPGLLGCNIVPLTGSTI
ncbi:unnamed protein product [Caenorhabditis angaria]|uniref:26S proteasome non-ATPase regulatory subunit 9 n=1 Tax=Caenorhabditis angaria TaxID=860376 RepID=A0A9P1ICE6_9PELO|nr:unnamed protein product [Caenorhabditis angaria]